MDRRLTVEMKLRFQISLAVVWAGPKGQIARLQQTIREVCCEG